jgi:cytoskeletal protein CcmA (bactofilin family)
VVPEFDRTLQESEVSLISEGSRFEGTLELDSVARFHGALRGRLVGKPGSLIVLGESGIVEGEIDADTIWVEGFVRGGVRGKTRVVLSPTARVIGDLESPSIEIQPGAYFDGNCRMEK